MTNLEFYKDELKEKISRIQDPHTAMCAGGGVSNFIWKHSKEIGFNGDPSKFVDWLLEEHKETTKMTLHEKCILESLPNEYSYIARDENGDLYIYRRKPVRENDFWFLPDQNGICSLNLYSNLFEFIKWEDGVRHIKDILKSCEVTKND